jgi:AmmeMemoRadiSam system protein B/AmmeMemoRadiSam system protein A
MIHKLLVLAIAAVVTAIWGSRACGAENGKSSGKTVRQPAVAGQFYPDDPKKLQEVVDKYLQDGKAASAGKVRAMICPHAGYPYSGPVAGVAYSQIDRPIDTVVIMAPSHTVAFEGASIQDVDAYRTPLGDIPLSPKVKQLARTAPFTQHPKALRVRAGMPDDPHAREHSLEVQLPFLQRALKGPFTLIPIIFGDVDETKVAETLSDLADNDKTLFIASSDLSHYHPYNHAVEKDAECIRAVCQMDFPAMRKEEACGKGPILTLMHLADAKGWTPVLLDYRNSGDTSGDSSSGVVGYTAIVFVEDGKAKTMLELARASLTAAVRDQPPPPLPESLKDTKAMEKAGCFVTLTERGKLRGCIGYIFPRNSLCEAIRDNARNASLNDPRFSKVRPDELKNIEIEISVLTVPKPLEFSNPKDLLSKLRPYVDGMVLELPGGGQATYLPQVWEQLPGKALFLGNLAMKAGGRASDWLEKGTKVLTYQVEAFKEGEH